MPLTDARPASRPDSAAADDKTPASACTLVALAFVERAGESADCFTAFPASRPRCENCSGSAAVGRSSLRCPWPRDCRSRAHALLPSPAHAGLPSGTAQHTPLIYRPGLARLCDASASQSHSDAGPKLGCVCLHSTLSHEATSVSQQSTPGRGARNAVRATALAEG